MVRGSVLIHQPEWNGVISLLGPPWPVHLCDISVVLYVEFQSLCKVLEIAYLHRYMYNIERVNHSIELVVHHNSAIQPFATEFSLPWVAIIGRLLTKCVRLTSMIPVPKCRPMT